MGTALRNPSNPENKCLFCGRRLSPYNAVVDVRPTDKFRPPARCPVGAYDQCGSTKFEPDTERGAAYFRCVKCGEQASGNRIYKRRVITPATRFGRYGDNLFCGKTCGYSFGRAFGNAGHRLREKT